MTLTAPQLSIVLPAHNEADNLPEIMPRIHAAMAGTAADYEIILVDDGSTDATWERAQHLRLSNSNLRLIRLSRNFGKEAALSAGLRAARGAAVVTLDCDLQHPPETIPQMLEAWRQGGEIIMALRQGRENDHPLRRFSTKIYYRIMSRLSEIDVPVGLGDFNLYDRRVVEAILRLPERNLYMKGVVSWVGFRRITLPMVVAPRRQGQSDFPLSRLLRLAMIGITAFSNLPLRIWSALGVLISLIALLYAILIVAQTLLYGIEVPGFATITVAVLFLGGIQLISLGVIGDYLGRVFSEVKARPLYLEAERQGFDEDPEESLMPAPMSARNERRMQS
jgi:polyisoprenyl-phosphate glycosyltransferase